MWLHRKHADLWRCHSEKLREKNRGGQTFVVCPRVRDIDDLYQKLLAKFPSISLATIYKNINAMVEKVFLSEVKLPNTNSFHTNTLHLLGAKCITTSLKEAKSNSSSSASSDSSTSSSESISSISSSSL